MAMRKEGSCVRWRGGKLYAAPVQAGASTEKASAAAEEMATFVAAAAILVPRPGR